MHKRNEENILTELTTGCYYLDLEPLNVIHIYTSIY